jgi:hypothetical protein
MKKKRKVEEEKVAKVDCGRVSWQSIFAVHLIPPQPPTNIFLSPLHPSPPPDKKSQLAARMEGPAVDDVSFLAYASVVNLKVVGTWGDERTITVHSFPAVVKSTPAAPAMRSAPFGLLALAGDLHKTVLACLKPNWVREGGGGREGGRGGRCS